MNAELAMFEALAKEIFSRVLADEDPEELRKWLSEKVARLGSGNPEAVMSWDESFNFTEAMLAEYELIATTPEADRKLLSWPWQSWANYIDPLEPGMLAVITAPDGQGKTIYAESLAEHWAKSRNRVVFVHYELNRKLMMLRRTARHTDITVRELKGGRLTVAQKMKISEVRPRLMQWDGYISYVHTPGWSMERTIAQLSQLRADGLCDVVVLDYLEKAAASTRQLKMFGSNVNQREADNVEQLKNFAEATDIPVLMVTQMSKEGKRERTDDMDRNAIRGAGEKSDKANLVVLLKRERIGEGYSNTVQGLIDKNTMGSTGTFVQMMQPEYFRVGDVAR